MIFGRCAKVAICAVLFAHPSILRGNALSDCARIFEAEIREGVVHGAAVVAGGLDGETLSGAWGWADAAHTLPMTTRTVVDVASVTKAAAGVTAYLVAHARGAVDFDTPFTNYLASYTAPLARKVAIRDLANHVSGFGEADGGPRVYFSKDPQTMLRNVLSMPPAAPKCGMVVYSCRNYFLLGQAFEALTGRRVDDFCRKEIFDPLGMKDTALGAPPPGIGVERLAQTMCTKQPGVISDEVARPLWAAGIGTFNAGLFSTAEDLAKLMRAYLRGGVCDNGTRLFGPAEMAQIVPSTNRVEGARMFGWQYATADLPNELRGTSLFHSGWSGQTVLFDLKRRRYAVVLTTRCGDYNRAKRDRFKAIAALIGHNTSHEDEKPFLRVAIMSDIQGQPYPEDAGMRNLERALDVLAPLKPDVIVNNGDINDSGNNMDAVAYYKARCDARLGKIPHVACMGNHEIGFITKENRPYRTSAVCLREFNAVFGSAPDDLLVHKVIGGCDFVALSLSRIEGYTTVEIARLKDALDAAVARDAMRPIFVVTHYHPLRTVNDSRSEAQGGALRRLLDAYPQAISISGHTHNPLQDPRSIWQGAFTAVDTSTLCYGCIENSPPAVNQISCLIPYGHESVGFMLLEVFRDHLVFRRFSARDGREIEPDSRWTIPWPHNSATAPYSFARRRAAESAPQFGGDAEPTLWYDFGYVYLLFNAAEDRSSVFGYRIELSDEGGDPKSYFQLSDYYRIPEHRQRRVVFKAPPRALMPGGSYRCRIFPVGFFGSEGKPCDWRFTIRSSYCFRTEVVPFVQE